MGHIKKKKKNGTANDCVIQMGPAIGLDIDLGMQVSTLKKILHFALRCHLLYDFAANELKLRLSLKDGKWLRSGDKLREYLQGPIDPARQILAKSLKLEDYLSSDFESTYGVIHILVEYPTLQPVPRTETKRRMDASTETLFQIFVTVLAQNIAMLYNFDAYSKFTTIKTVFGAAGSRTWRFRVENGKELTTIALPDLFEAKEWALLRKLYD